MDTPGYSYHPQAIFEWAQRHDDPSARRFLGPVAPAATTAATATTVHAIIPPPEGQSGIYNTISTHSSPPYPSPLSASQLQSATSMTSFAIPDSSDVRAKSPYQDYSYPATSSTNNATPSSLAPPPPPGSVINYSQMSHSGPTTTASTTTTTHHHHPTSMPTPGYYDPSSPSSYIHMDYSQRRQYLPSSRSTAQQPGPIRPRLWRVRSRPYQDPNAAATGAAASNGGSSAGSASSPSSEMQLATTTEERRKALREQYEAQLKLLPPAAPSHPVEDVSTPGTPLVQPPYSGLQQQQQQPTPQQQQQPLPPPQVDQQYAQASLATPSSLNQSAGPSTHHSHHHHPHQYTHQTTHPPPPHHLPVITPPLAYHHHHPHVHHHQPQTQTHYHTDTKEDMTNADADPKPFSIDARSSNSSPAVSVASAAIENQYTTVFIHSNLPRRAANGGTGAAGGTGGNGGSGSSADDGAEDYAEYTNFFPLQTEEHRQLRIAMHDIMNAEWKIRNELEPTSRDILQFSNKIIGDDGLVKYTCLLYHNGEPCAKSWVRAERMLAHLRGAIDLRPFACEGDGDVCNCGLRFFAEDTLQQHRKNTRTIGCEYCGAAVTPRNIKRHLRHNCAKAPNRGQ